MGPGEGLGKCTAPVSSGGVHKGVQECLARGLRVYQDVMDAVRKAHSGRLQPSHYLKKDIVKCAKCWSAMGLECSQIIMPLWLTTLLLSTWIIPQILAHMHWKPMALNTARHFSTSLRGCVCHHSQRARHSHLAAGTAEGTQDLR